MEVRDRVPNGTEPPTERQAVAYGRIFLPPNVLDALGKDEALKGELLASSRIAGLFAAKRAGDFVPHALSAHLTQCDIDLQLSEPSSEIRINVTLKAFDRIGIEIHAMTAVSAACLAAYDLLCSLDPGVRIEVIELIERQGGPEGLYRRPLRVQRLTPTTRPPAEVAFTPITLAPLTLPPATISEDEEDVDFGSLDCSRSVMNGEERITLTDDSEGPHRAQRSKGRRRCTESAKRLISKVTDIAHDDARLLELLRVNPVNSAFMLRAVQQGSDEHAHWYTVSPAHSAIRSALFINDELGAPMVMTTGDAVEVEALFAALYKSLPTAFDVQIPRHHQFSIEGCYELHNIVSMFRMGMALSSCDLSGDVEGVERLGHKDTGEMMHLMQNSAFFDPSMIDQGLYCGVRVGGELICTAGVSAICDDYDVAALGRVVTHPDYDAKEYAGRSLRWLLREVQKRVGRIALNIEAEHQEAIAFYRSFGFEKRFEFITARATLRGSPLNGHIE